MHVSCGAGRGRGRAGASSLAKPSLKQDGDTAGAAAPATRGGRGSRGRRGGRGVSAAGRLGVRDAGVTKPATVPPARGRGRGRGRALGAPASLPDKVHQQWASSVLSQKTSILSW